MSTLIANLAFFVIWLCAGTQSYGADAVISRRPVFTTNYVVVTNIVIVTNYLATTNVVQGTGSLMLGPAKPALPDISWVPPQDGFDWVQLKSGEWLKGRLKAMQNRKLEFESEELDLLTFDWKDIRQARSTRIQDVLSVSGETVSGPVTITPDRVMVSGAEDHEFPRDELQSLTPGGSRELDYWSGKLTLGLSLSAGNTKSVAYNAAVSLQRRTPDTRLGFDYLGNVSRVNQVENANNHRVSGEFDYWLSRRLYLVVPYVEYFSDPFQNIERRATASIGLGYDLVDRPTVEWNVTAGPAYQYTWFDSVAAGQSASQGAAALVLSSRFKWEISRRIDLILDYRGQYTSREVGESFHHWVTTLSVELTKRFDLDVSFVWDRTQNPKEQSDGTTPSQNDFRLTVGLGIDF
ncbi:MAG: DUF481 domain-containing protein [Opitutaceae bacterium]|nr:DUF481 domain-containing protein [Verrucomicrobiales bacterium]